VSHLKLLTVLACLAAMLGCPAAPGESCRPGHNSDCAGAYYCSFAGICTKDCRDDDDCAFKCSSDAVPGDTCGSCEGEVCPTCDADLLCRPAPATCIDDYCQQDCALTDDCNYDPYRPREDD